MNEEELKKIIDAPDLPGEYSAGREETVRGMIMDSFRTRLRWLVVVLWIYIWGFLAVAIFSAWRFFQVEETRAMILYATVFITAMMFVSVCKLWYWQFMGRNLLLRDVKRLSLQIAELTERVGGK
ncbi:MAG: hypothetical protein IH624_15990 [Phycisphaerae bacterium]|nr:hypothetical protein [Phycisphaerae bacterium]